MIDLDILRLKEIALSAAFAPAFLAFLAAGAFMAAALLALGFMARALAASERGRIAQLLEAELTGMKSRLQIMSEMSCASSAEAGRAIHERFDRVSQNLGQNLSETERRTSDHLTRLYERLAVIDAAQKNIAELSSRMVSLQDIFACKQARGAFGQRRMETIIEDALPAGAYSFQAALSNGKRPDCLIRMPGGGPGIVIDAKFPLEAFEALRSARAPEERNEAMRGVKVACSRHIESIAAKYALPGETQDTLLMFVPSESLYAELHEHFPEILQKAYRARIIIVSPNMLMLAVQTIQTLLKDARLRNEAGLIQREIGLMTADVHRLRERVGDFQRRFGQLSDDVGRIIASSDKIAERGRRIAGAGAASDDGAPDRLRNFAASSSDEPSPLGVIQGGPR